MLTEKGVLRRASLLLVLLAAGPVAAYGQDISIAPKLRAGDTFQLEIVRTRENSLRPRQDGRSTTPVDVRVVSVTAAGITLEWTAGQTTFDNRQTADDPLVAAAANAVGGLKLRVMLKANGEYAGLRNQAEVTAALRKGTDVIIRGLVAKLPPEQQSAFQKMVGQALSPATLVASATREAQIYFGLHGVELGIGKVMAASIEQPNPFGTGTIPAVWRAQLESVTDESASARTTMTYDAAALKKMTLSLIAQSGRPVPPEALAQVPPIEMADEGRYLFDRTTGLMREVVLSRLMTTGGNRRLDGWEIRLAKGPAR